MKLFTFRLGDADYGIESNYVYRVLDQVRITPVCLMPPFYLGLLYYRGELFDAIDLNTLMNQEAPRPQAQRLVVVRWGDRKLALSPSSISGLLWIEDSQQQESVISGDGRSVRLVAPQQIWDRMTQQLKSFDPDLPLSRGSQGNS